MREIKFRGKRVDNGEWVYGSYILGNIGSEINYQKSFIINNDFNISTTLIDNLKNIFEVMPETIGQYTDKKDINKNEIYVNDKVMMNNQKEFGIIKFGEHDILDMENETITDKAYGFYIQPVDKVFPFNVSIPLTNLYIQRLNLKVIKNTIDNKDLLGEQYEHKL